MDQSATIGKLAEALSKAQATMKPAAKDSKNPFFKSSYADLSSIWEAVRGPLTTNGLSVVQLAEGNGEVITIITTLLHISGEWIRGTLTMKPVKPDPQGAGSALTYARRYGLAAMVGVVAEEDDDGNAASRRHEEKPEPKKVDDEVEEARKTLTSAMYGKDAPFKRNAPAMAQWIKQETGKTFTELNAMDCQDLLAKLAKGIGNDL